MQRAPTNHKGGGIERTPGSVTTYNITQQHTSFQYFSKKQTRKTVHESERSLPTTCLVIVTTHLTMSI